MELKDQMEPIIDLIWEPEDEANQLPPEMLGARCGPGGIGQIPVACSWGWLC